MFRTTLIRSLLVGLCCLAACSTTNAPSHPATSPPQESVCCSIDQALFLVDLLTDSPTIFFGEVVDAGENGEVGVRPISSLKGEPAADTEGLVRVASATPVELGLGIWVLDSGGQPATLKDPDFDAASYPYPWTMNDLIIQHSVETVFPGAVLAEANRVLAAADLLVQVHWPNDVSSGSGGQETAVIDQVLRGPSLESCAPITFRYKGVPTPPNLTYSEAAVFALIKVQDEWVTVPSWLDAGWDYREMETTAVIAAFPGYHLESIAIQGDGSC